VPFPLRAPRHVTVPGAARRIVKVIYPS